RDMDEFTAGLGTNADEKFQAPPSKLQYASVGAWNLEFGCSLDVGAWSLELFPPSAVVSESAGVKNVISWIEMDASLSAGKQNGDRAAFADGATAHPPSAGGLDDVFDNAQADADTLGLAP